MFIGQTFNEFRTNLATNLENCEAPEVISALVKDLDHEGWEGYEALESAWLRIYDDWQLENYSDAQLSEKIADAVEELLQEQLRPRNHAPGLRLPRLTGEQVRALALAVADCF